MKVLVLVLIVGMPGHVPQVFVKFAKHLTMNQCVETGDRLVRDLRIKNPQYEAGYICSYSEIRKGVKF